MCSSLLSKVEPTGIQVQNPYNRKRTVKDKTLASAAEVPEPEASVLENDEFGIKALPGGGFEVDLPLHQVRD